MLDFLNSLGKKIVSQPERVSTDTYSDAITGQVKDTVSDYVQNFPIADPELYSKLFGVGMPASALGIPAELLYLSSHTPLSPLKPFRESGVLEPALASLNLPRKDATIDFLFNLGSKLNPESTTFQRTGSPTEEYALGVLPDILIGGSAPNILKIPSLVKKADDFIQENTADGMREIAEALALAGQTRRSPLSLASMTGEASLGKTTFPRELDENYFFNKAYEISRNLDQEKGTPDQFRSMFEKGGVTKDEFRWSGLGEYLKEQKQANLPVTKEGLTDFLDENRMSVNINELAKQSTAEPEVSFVRSNLGPEDDYVKQIISNRKRGLHYSLRTSDAVQHDELVDEVLDIVFENQMVKTYDERDLDDFFVAGMKEGPFKGQQQMSLLMQDKIPEPSFGMRGMEIDGSSTLKKKMEDMPQEQADKLNEEWRNFRDNLTISASRLKQPQNPSFDELYMTFGNLGANDSQTFASLFEKYPLSGRHGSIFSREGFNSVEKLQDWQSQVDEAFDELVVEKVMDLTPHQVDAYDRDDNLLYSAAGDFGEARYSATYGDFELNNVTDLNVVKEIMQNTAFDRGLVQRRNRELYEEYTPPDVFGTREAYNVNLYEDTSDLARKEFESPQSVFLKSSDVYQQTLPKKLQSHFSQYANEFPIGHARSTIRDLDGQGVEFEDDYLKIHNDYLEAQVDEQRRILEADDTPERRYGEVREALQGEIDSFYRVGEYEPLKLSSKAIKSSNLDGKVYAIHEIQSDVAQQLTSPRSSAMTPSGIEKAKNEARKAIGKNPESKMMEFDERAEDIRERFIKFGEKYDAFNSKMFSDAPTYEKPKKKYDSDSINELFDNYAVARDSNDYYEIVDYFDFSNLHLPLLGKDDYIPYSLLRVKEEITQDFRKLGKDIETYGNALENLEDLEKTKPTVMDAPYIQEKRDTTRIMLKGEIAKAVDANADYVTLGEPIFNRERQGFTDAEEFYGVAVPKIAEKILKPLDPDIKLIDLDVGTGEVVKGFKITEKLKNALREQGQSYFAPFTAIGTGILGSQVAKEQENSYE